MKKTLAVLVVASSLSANVFAIDLGTTVETSNTETRGYVGLNWTLGGSPVPALVLGVTNAKVKSSGDLTGANLSVSIKLDGGLALDALKLNYLNGRNDVYGQAGVGYSLTKAAPFVGVGVTGSYIGAGVDVFMDKTIAPFGNIHTLDLDKPKAKVQVPI